MTSHKWYNGPPDAPLLVFVYRHRMFGVLSDDCDRLEKVREHYDNLGTKYKFQFKLSKRFIVRLDYYPKQIDDLWVIQPTLYCDSVELGRVDSIDIIDGDTLRIKTGILAVELYLPGIEKRYLSIKQTEDLNDRLDREEEEDRKSEEEFRRRYG